VAEAAAAATADDDDIKVITEAVHCRLWLVQQLHKLLPCAEVGRRARVCTSCVDGRVLVSAPATAAALCVPLCLCLLRLLAQHSGAATG
jgi:hypothetical protein